MINLINFQLGAYDQILSADNTSANEIGSYYLSLISGLNVNKRLNNEEKIGQLAFLINEWQAQLNEGIPTSPD